MIGSNSISTVAIIETIMGAVLMACLHLRVSCFTLRLVDVCLHVTCSCFASS